ncbi:MAG TPA: type II toxin-antitoxin system VapC family toxin [Candidatus Acidoferrales bacterium]|nr:type II toxin-antitoxin system VapC family toxin [Candidatus Acidoferrales bacterium]
MRLLLDTHIWLWALLEPNRLGLRTATALKDAQTEKWLSPISIWEFMVLTDKGRVKLPAMEPEAWVARALNEFPIKEAPVTAEVVFAMRTVRLPHRDPADAFLAATAKTLDLTLVTADTRLLGVKGISILANR